MHVHSSWDKALFIVKAGSVAIKFLIISSVFGMSPVSSSMHNSEEVCDSNGHNDEHVLSSVPLPFNKWRAAYQRL
jgi:hypothetical protein